MITGFNCYIYSCGPEARRKSYSSNDVRHVRLGVGGASGSMPMGARVTNDVPRLHSFFQDAFHRFRQRVGELPLYRIRVVMSHVMGT
jgi:hypothetical protein